jgi:Phage derived protein Gp49-like (DUF891)
MPVLWTIRSYVSHRGINEIREWYGNQSARCRAKFLDRVQYLAQTPRSGWKREPFDLLRDYDLGEIRFNVDGVQHRPIGFFSPSMTFTIVMCAIEKNRKFIPKNALETAEAKKREIENDASRCCPFWLPLE